MEILQRLIDCLNENNMQSEVFGPYTRGRRSESLEAGTHTDAIKMGYRDYEKMVRPKVADLAPSSFSR